MSEVGKPVASPFISLIYNNFTLVLPTLSIRRTDPVNYIVQVPTYDLIDGQFPRMKETMDN